MVLALLLGGWISSTTPASAHPHVFVTMQTEIVYNERQEITGFRQKWAFDELYSTLAAQGTDTNGDGVYDRQELQPLAEVNVQSLKDFGYFTFPKLAQAQIELEPPQDYWLDYIDGVLVLNFTINLSKPISMADAKNFSFSIYDPSIYVAFAYSDQQPVTLASQAPKSCMAVLQAPKSLGMPQTLSEATFESIDPNSGLAQQFASTVRIQCGA